MPRFKGLAVLLFLRQALTRGPLRGLFYAMYTDVLQLEEELDKLLDDFGFQVVDLVIAGRTPNRVFRLFIDRVDGGPVTLGDCSALSRQLSLYLESRELFDPMTCSLEISSPGLDRILKR